MSWVYVPHDCEVPDYSMTPPCSVWKCDECDELWDLCQEQLPAGMTAIKWSRRWVGRP